MKVFVAQVNPTVGDFEGNLEKILKSIDAAKRADADICLFSEMIITGYPAQDFLHHDEFIRSADKTLEKIVDASKGIS
ncbi:MAG: NAD+ synthase, partial [Chlamydiia bacterium]|nr:NAD+ synthase [Chlamydiia bacterium]